LCCTTQSTNKKINSLFTQKKETKLSFVRLSEMGTTTMRYISHFHSHNCTKSQSSQHPMLYYIAYYRIYNNNIIFKMNPILYKYHQKNSRFIINITFMFLFSGFFCFSSLFFFFFAYKIYTSLQKKIILWKDKAKKMVRL
jgi:hypothetical protein